MLLFPAMVSAQPAEMFQVILEPAWRPPVQGAPRLERAHEEVFTKLGRPYLRVAFLVDRESLRGRPAGTKAQAWILRGQIWCARRTVVLQGIGEKVRLEGVQRQLRTHWPEGVFDPQRPSVVAFLALLSRPMQRRETLEYVWEPGGRTHIRHGAEAWTTFTDPLLQRALLRIAFGNTLDPEAPELARALEAFASRS